MVQKMFKNTFQSGFLSILYSLGSKPLQIWDKEEVSRGGQLAESRVFSISGIGLFVSSSVCTQIEDAELNSFLHSSALVSCAYERVTFGISIIPIVKDESILILHYSVKLSPHPCSAGCILGSQSSDRKAGNGRLSKL
ncbi:hypothetical protein VNO78_07202 [Psophocarpus tetragonolobus]|uniref:CFA20 domain-containing protein n=1 Tax=Psophocarpus tetragonolobus TaxID=3891 RepID=A0AAN9T2S5_PSOTE